VFDVAFEQVARAAARKDKPLSLICLDIDHFKLVNDTFGHQAGDLVIRAVADAIREHAGPAGTLCRWGGEEFLLLMEGRTVEQATQTAEAIREAVKSQIVSVGRQDIRVTISCGVGRYRPGEELFSLIARVDAALYRAKNEGRDRVSVAA